jgi:hypothetical protein
MCGSGGDAAAELLFETEFWDFFYCPNCAHWFQSSAKDAGVAFPVKRKGHERALTLLYTERIQQLEGIRSTGATLDRLRRKTVLFAARVYLKLSRLTRR